MRLGAVLWVLLGYAGWAGEQAHDAPAGLAAGAAAPEFSLRDQSGHERTLESLMGPRGLVLVFFRSADW